jgi:hypothetical protein
MVVLRGDSRDNKGNKIPTHGTGNWTQMEEKEKMSSK